MAQSQLQQHDLEMPGPLAPIFYRALAILEESQCQREVTNSQYNDAIKTGNTVRMVL